MTTALASSWKHARTVLQGWRKCLLNRIILPQRSYGLLGTAAGDTSCSLGAHLQLEGSQQLCPSLLTPLLDSGPLCLGTVQQLSDPGVQGEERVLLCTEPTLPISPWEPHPTRLQAAAAVVQVQRDCSRQMAHLCLAGCWFRSSFSPCALRASARDPRVLRSHPKLWCCCSKLWASLMSSWYRDLDQLMLRARSCPP